MTLHLAQDIDAVHLAGRCHHWRVDARLQCDALWWPPPVWGWLLIVQHRHLWLSFVRWALRPIDVPPHVAC